MQLLTFPLLLETALQFSSGHLPLPHSPVCSSGEADPLTTGTEGPVLADENTASQTRVMVQEHFM